jgi:hypothetical protein
MSQRDVENLRRGWDAWNGGDYELGLSLFDPDVVYVDRVVLDSRRRPITDPRTS